LRLFYSIGIYFASYVLSFLALFNRKLKIGVVGRKQTFKKLEKTLSSSDNVFWFHCASLGEYEQGLPVFKALKTKYPNYKIVLSFFSPSGYEVRKHTDLADVVVYLPLDTKANAKRFLDLVHPDYIIFVKYEIWPNFLLEMKKRQLKAILISAVFRETQSFFKWYGTLMRTALTAFDHIFVQDEHSKTLLKQINYHKTTISGDTRYDRVLSQLNQDNTVKFIESFIDGKTCIVFGSTWPKDDALFMTFINRNNDDNLKFIIAPHDLKVNYISSIKSQLNVSAISYSDKYEDEKLAKAKVFILDTIGYLNKVYSYAQIAYVGGAAGTTGLHNVLEPAVFGIPVIIGKNYDKFPEAKSLIKLGGITSVASAVEFEFAISELLSNKPKLKKQGAINSGFIAKNRGAVVQIIDYIRI
jgi:3-deoxy-D-manno-octulosonic-acid transferase